MISARSLALALATFTVTALASGVARADLPPPDGMKFVGFEFLVKGAPTAGDLALVAYPCSSSNGMPRSEAKAIGDGPVSVGRRGGNCRLYVTPRADFDKLMASLPPQPTRRDAALDDFFAKAKECEGRPSLTSAIPKSDPREVVREELAVVELSAARCKVAAVKAANVAGAATPPPSAAPASAPPTVPTAGGPPPARSGCSATPASATPRDAFGAIGLAVGLATALGARRRRRPSAA